MFLNRLAYMYNMQVEQLEKAIQLESIPLR